MRGEFLASLDFGLFWTLVVKLTKITSSKKFRHYGMLNVLREPDHIFIQAPTMMMISCLSSQPGAVLQAVLLTDKTQGMYCIFNLMLILSLHMSMYIHIYLVIFVHCTFREFIGEESFTNPAVYQ